VATTNRNFKGHMESEVYFSGAVVAAASAVVGKIVGPDDVIAFWYFSRFLQQFTTKSGFPISI